MTRTTMPKTWIFFFIIVLVLIIASFLQPSFKSRQIPPPSNTASDQILPPSREANADGMLKNGDNAVYLKDQSSGQSKIVVGYAVFAKPGFITIREDNKGLPGKIVGVSSLLHGRVDSPSVDLTTVLLADHVYYAELVSDDGNGTFEETNDLPVNDKDKSVVLMSFLAKTQTMSTAP
ncbi:MAG: hypothetical protein NTX72_02525 [Candidatus Uhrbacteria bacterium]|nr:hypothetical protein [Candidatus Uhrbacteria bacterium]